MLGTPPRLDTKSAQTGGLVLTRIPSAWVNNRHEDFLESEGAEMVAVFYRLAGHSRRPKQNGHGCPLAGSVAIRIACRFEFFGPSLVSLCYRL